MKILLVQTSFLGDIILATPLIAAIKRAYPGCQLCVLSTKQGCELLRRDPAIDKLYVFEKRGKFLGILEMLACARVIGRAGFDMAFSLHRSARTALLLFLSGIPRRVGFSDANLNILYTECRKRSRAQHAVMRNLSLLNDEDNVNADLSVYAPTLMECSRDFRDRQIVTDYVVLVPGSAWKTKQWGAEAYRNLALYLRSQGRSVVLVGSVAERELCESIAADGVAQNFAGQTSIAELMYLIKNAQVVVCNDSMTLHLASAFKVPCVSIFCATSPTFGFGPWKNRASVVERLDLSCKPCARHGADFCPKGTWACTSDILQNEVRKGIDNLSCQDIAC